MTRRPEPASSAGGRLVADDEPGRVDQRAGDGDALLLAAGQLAREPLGKLADVEGLERLGAAPDRFGPGRCRRRPADGGVLGRGEGRDRLYCWKMKPILASRNFTSALPPSS
jgi:hypothetical protein